LTSFSPEKPIVFSPRKNLLSTNNAIRKDIEISRGSDRASFAPEEAAWFQLVIARH